MFPHVPIIASMSLKMISWLLFFSSAISAMYIQPRTTWKGIQLDPSCDPYKSRIRSTFKIIRNLAKVGYGEAHHVDNPLYKKFFEPRDQQFVKTVFKNVHDSIAGRGVPFLLTCKNTDFCGSVQSGPLAYVQQYISPGNDTINLCPRGFRFGTVSDYCSNVDYEPTLATNIMHEMTHVWGIANKTIITDYTMSLDECYELPLGLGHFEDGTILSATLNAQSYIYLAEASMRYAAQRNSDICPASALVSEHNELRKLQGFDDTQANITDLATLTSDSSSPPSDTTTAEASLASSINSSTKGLAVKVYNFRELHVPTVKDGNVTIPENVALPANVTVGDFGLNQSSAIFP